MGQRVCADENIGVTRLGARLQKTLSPEPLYVVDLKVLKMGISCAEINLFVERERHRQ